MSNTLPLICAIIITCDQDVFSFRLVNPFLQKRETSNPERENKSDAKTRRYLKLLL